MLLNFLHDTSAYASTIIVLLNLTNMSFEIISFRYKHTLTSKEINIA